MNEEEMKNKYSAFITEISEILGLGKPVDILKLCATTDLFFQPLKKRIAELEKENAEIKNNNKVYCEGNGETLVVNVSFDSFTRINANHKMYYPHNNELEAQVEKLIDFVLSKTECCDVCPMTDTCINSEGTCPYAGILAKGEEEVTREWLMQFISKEIKEK